MEIPRPTSSVYSRDEDGVPFCHPAQPSAAKNGASLQFQSVIRTVKRLLWADGFQAEIFEAAQLLDQMRTLMHDGITEETLQRIESLSKSVVNILTAWTRRNQRISVDARLMKVAKVSAASQMDPNTRIQPLPTISGCEVNAEAARGMQTFFSDDSGFRVSTKESIHSMPTDIRVTNCLVATGDRLEDVAFSSKQASKDVAASWNEMSKKSLSIASSTGQEKKYGKKGKQTKGKFTIKKLFSKRSGKANDTSTDEPFDTVQSDYSLGMFYANSLTPLSALPPSLVNIEAQQAETIEHGSEERHDSVSVASHNGEEHQSVDLGRPGVLSQLEREIKREFVQRIQAKGAGSPEASGTRSWWRERALQDLEGQEPEEDNEEWEWEDCEEQEGEGEELSEEEAAEKKARDVAEALEKLEGDADSCSDSGSARRCR